MTNTSVAELAFQAAEQDSLPPCGDNPRLWFSELPAELEMAKAACRACPLRRPCLAGAVARREPWGVWGGEIFEKGMVIEAKRPRGRPVEAAS